MKLSFKIVLWANLQRVLGKLVNKTNQYLTDKLCDSVNVSEMIHFADFFEHPLCAHKHRRIPLEEENQAINKL